MTKTKTIEGIRFNLMPGVIWNGELEFRCRCRAKALPELEKALNLPAKKIEFFIEKINGADFIYFEKV